MNQKPKEIKTKDDWWAMARYLAPLLPTYADDHRLSWDEDAFLKAINDNDHETAWAMANQLWADLPDNPSIRYVPFFDLCDLCSEYWVFEEEQTS